MPKLEKIVSLRVPTPKFLTDCMEEGDLDKAERLVIVAQMPDGEWKAFWKNITPTQVAYASLLLQREALNDLDASDPHNAS